MSNISPPSSLSEAAQPRSRLGTVAADTWCLLFAVLIVAAGVALEYPRFEATISKSRVFFVDPDDYTRTYRAKQILAGETHRVRNMPRINHPDGVELHWTAVMDYLIAGAGVLGTFVSRHPDSVGLGAAWAPVGLGVLYLVCMMSWIRRGAGWGPALLAGSLVICSPPFHRTFQLGHADHHALLELLFVVAIGAWMTRGGAPTRRAAIVSGSAIGMAIWTSSQALPIWAALAVGIHYGCRRCDPRFWSEYQSARMRWCVSAAVVVGIGFAFENWPDLSLVAVDKVSAFHVALAIIALLAPGGRNPSDKGDAKTDAATPEQIRTSAEEQKRTTRTILFLAAVAVLAVWLAVKFEDVVAPLTRPEVARWHEYVAELQPLFTRTETQWSLKPFHDRLGFLPYALVLLVPLFLSSKRTPPALKCTLGLLAILITALTLGQMRWMDHYNLAAIPVAAIGLWEGFGRLFAKSPKPKPALCFALTGIVLGALSLPASRIVLARKTEHVLAAQGLLERTDFVGQNISRQESAFGPSNPKRRAILCEEGEGPMLLYYTGLPVVASPYHRAIDGIVEAAQFYAETDPAVARAQLDRLGVRYVVMPYRAHEQLMSFEHIAFGELRSFDRPDAAINEMGRIMLKLNYRQEKVARTMAYRLVMESNAEVIPGVEKIAEIDEGAVDADGRAMRTGLLYVVHELSDAKPASEESPKSSFLTN